MLSHWTWSSPIQLHWLAWILRGPPVSISPMMGLQTLTATPNCMWVLGNWTPASALFLKILHVFPRQFFARVALNPEPHQWQARSLGELPRPKSYSFKFWIFGIKNVHHFKIPFMYSGPPSSMRSPLLCRAEMIFFIYSSMRSKENTPSLLLSTLY